MGIVAELVKTHGPDSFIARLAASAYGSTETTFYVLAVYFGAVGIKKARHAVVTGLIADIVSLIAAYGLVTKRWWALWMVVALFFVAATISLYTIFFILLSNLLVSVGLIVYLVLSLYFMYYTYTRRNK